MLKKGHHPQFTRPMSNMRMVLSAVEMGYCSRHTIVVETGLKLGQVTSALWNLSFIKAIIAGKDDCGRVIYVTPGKQTVAKCLCGVNSIFNVR